MYFHWKTCWHFEEQQTMEMILLLPKPFVFCWVLVSFDLKVQLYKKKAMNGHAFYVHQGMMYKQKRKGSILKNMGCKALAVNAVQQWMNKKEQRYILELQHDFFCKGEIGLNVGEVLLESGNKPNRTQWLETSLQRQLTPWWLMQELME